MNFLKNLFGGTDPKVLAKALLIGLVDTTARKEVAKRLAFTPELKANLREIEMTDSQIAKAEKLINNAHTDEVMEWVGEKIQKL